MRKNLYKPRYYVISLSLEEDGMVVREKGFRAFSNVLRCYYIEMEKENVIMAKIIRKDYRGRRYEVIRPFYVLDESMYKHNIELS